MRLHVSASGCKRLREFASVCERPGAFESANVSERLSLRTSANLFEPARVRISEPSSIRRASKEHLNLRASEEPLKSVQQASESSSIRQARPKQRLGEPPRCQSQMAVSNYLRVGYSRVIRSEVTKQTQASEAKVPRK